jgi:hypothetical protein
MYKISKLIFNAQHHLKFNMKRPFTRMNLKRYYILTTPLSKFANKKKLRFKKC